MGTSRQIATIWKTSDALWHEIEPILLNDAPPKSTGRPRAEFRQIFDGIIFRMRSGCQWAKIPPNFGDDSTLHRWFQRWCENGVMEKIWARLVSYADELEMVAWHWQSVDGSMSKARFPGDRIGPNPTDRGKRGTKKSLIVDASGGPLGVVVAGANVHDSKLLESTVEAIVIARPDPEDVEQNLCLDKAYDSRVTRFTAVLEGYEPHIRSIGEERRKCRRGKPRRWVVERTISWLSRCRAILVRYDKKSVNYLGMIQLACALLWYRRLIQ
jgi:putative transposase